MTDDALGGSPKFPAPVGQGRDEAARSIGDAAVERSGGGLEFSSGSAAPAALAGRGAGPLGQWGWALYEWGRTPYFLLINIYIFAPYFSRVVVGDPVRGQALWGYGTSIAAALIAVTGPIVGAVADAGGRRKPWLLGCTLVALPAMCALWLAAPGLGERVYGVGAAALVAGVCFEYTVIFHNALLPSVAPADRIGRLSGLGLALGNLGGILVLVFFLAAWAWPAHPLFGLDRAKFEPERAVGILSAVWFGAFSLPLFLFTPDTPGTGVKLGAAVRDGLKTLAGTVAKLGQYRNIAIYIVARMIYNDAFVVILFFSGIYAAGLFGWNSASLTVFGILMSIVAAAGAYIGGKVDERIGSKRTVQLALGGCLLSNVLTVSITPKMVLFIPITPSAPTGALFGTLPEHAYLAVAVLGAICITAAIASSRTLMARLAPPAMMTEFFGLFALSGNATSFLGPLSIGVLTSAFTDQRAGLLAVPLLLATGLGLVSFVRPPAPSARTAA